MTGYLNSDITNWKSNPSSKLFVARASKCSVSVKSLDRAAMSNELFSQQRWSCKKYILCNLEKHYDINTDSYYQYMAIFQTAQLKCSVMMFVFMFDLFFLNRHVFL